VPNRPARPGKHAARHKAPSALSRATARLPTVAPGLGLRTTGGTVVAMGAVVLAGAAANGLGEEPSDSGEWVSATTPDRASVPGRHAARVTDADDGRAGDDRATERRARVAEARSETVSRSHAREPLDTTRDEEHRHAPLPQGTGSHIAQAQDLVPDSPRGIARSMLDEYGWESQFGCLNRLYISESNWEVRAENPSSGAYGIPQSLPAGKMASAGSDWRTNPETQLEWGLSYIESRYGSPCDAWEFKQYNNWY
jgi:colicin import membrane protein